MAKRDLRSEGKIKAFGASVESVEEGLHCLNVEGINSLQIIFNVFRQKPIQELLPEAERRGVSIIVRLPLASGLLAGKWTHDSQFVETDHRNFNADGQAFNGETFAGLPFEKGLELVDQLRQWVPADCPMSEWAIRWCLDFPAVTTVIPGATRVEQVRSNANASARPRITPTVHEHLAEFYKNHVAANIRGKY
ncbi:MAG: aldo/keto reductase [Pirellulaceae bacterium]